MAEVKEPSKPPLPAWRVELNEKVRAIKAQKEALKNSEFSSRGEGVADSGSLSVSRDTPSPASPHNGFGTVKTLHPSNDLAQDEEASPTLKHADNHRVVERALSRVKRASENAMRASLPRIEPLRSTTAATALAVDREATARVLQPPVIRADEQTETLPIPVTRKPPVAQPAQREVVSPLRPPGVAEATFIEKPVEPIRLIDEDVYLDYLDAEVEKVDRELHKSMSLAESPDLFTHILINTIDFAVIGISCTPFFILMKLISGSFLAADTLLASGVLVSLIAIFYLMLTQVLCGKTIGMMAANSHIIDALNNQRPSIQIVLLRTLGYFLSVVPAFAGFFWITLDPQRRSWHDKLSGTMVVKDF
ncbi:MAG: RDD family protein [Acidobacteria bacterium]|nr:RDD family protein [Acidobacteriota bacterium]